MSKKLYIKTLGCAMNVRDSEHIIAELTQRESYTLTEQFEDADLILINTCSVREKPVHKLFSEIGQFNAKKKEGAKIGVCGCTATHLGDEIIKKAPSVDFVLGARNVSKITKVLNTPKAVEVDIDYDESAYPFKDYRSDQLKAYINISIGCDKKCTYCIVPNTRGEEISITPDIILDESKRAVDSGAKEIILLGQNVNNYGRRFSNFDKKMNFTKLLQEVSKIEGLKRIRFTSPHPLHMDDEFIEEFASNDKICKSMHMPLQSGSTKILSLMKRGYTKEWFLNRALKLREMIKDVSISTDIIVGFPSESEEDFLDTLDIVKEVKFNQIFSFAYSPRPHTEAKEFKEQIDKKVASKRLERLQELHKKELDEINSKEVGKIYSMLVEARDEEYLTGRSDNNFLIKIKSDENLIGSFVDVKITQSHRMSLEAVRV